MNAIALHTPQHSQPLQSGALEIRGLSKAYRIEGQALPVLQCIDLSVHPGEFVSIVGTSGCGKSTLLRLIVGLENDYAGEILLDGKRVVGTSLERGIVFQDHRLFPWMTLSQNIALALNRKVTYDLKKHEFVNDAQANRLRSEALREPWRL